MTNPTYIAGLVGLAGFAIASIVFLAGYPSKKNQTQMYRVGTVVLFLATLSVTFAAFGRYSGRVWADSSGLMLTIFLGWFTLFVSWRFSMRPIAAFTVPVATLVLFLQFFFTSTNPAPHLDHSLAAVLAGFHVLMAAIGQAFAICACAVSVLYVAKQSALKSKQLSRMPQGTPALDRLGKLLMGCLWAGFVFITIGLVTGVVYTQTYLEYVSLELSYKITWGILVWLLYLVTLSSRIIFAWPIKNVAYMSFAGFALLTASLFGILFTRPFGG